MYQALTRAVGRPVDPLDTESRYHLGWEVGRDPMDALDRTLGFVAGFDADSLRTEAASGRAAHAVRPR